MSNAVAVRESAPRNRSFPIGNFPRWEFSPAEFDALSERVRTEFEWINGAQKMLPLRAVFLGIVTSAILSEMPRGQSGPWIKKYLRGKRSFAYRIMAVGHACVVEAKLQLPQLIALNQLQLDFTPRKKGDDAAKTLRRMERWIAGRSLSELYAAYYDGTPKLGGARNKPAQRIVDLDALKAMKREEAAGLIERARSLLLRENILQFLEPIEVRNFVDNFSDLATELRAAAKNILKEHATA